MQFCMENSRHQEIKRIMENAESSESSQLPQLFEKNKDFRKFLNEAEKVCPCIYNYIVIMYYVIML